MNNVLSKIFNKKVFVALLAVFLGVIVGGILMSLTKNNPIEGYKYLIQGGTMNISRIGDTIATATPLILTGLSVAFAFRTGLFNIGAPGQVLVGGFAALAVGLTVEGPQIMVLPLMILVSALAGALWGVVPGVLKAKFNVHEVVSSIMMNWIAYWVIFYAVPGYFKGGTETESLSLAETATLKVQWLTDLFDGSFINLGVFIALIAVMVVAFILNKTTLGYELKAVGFNRYAAEYAGISVNRNIILSMMIAGSLAGLAGLAHYAGNSNLIQIGILPTQGFDGIAIALLGASNPLGVLFAALFFGLLYIGTGFMSAMTTIPPEIAETIIAIIIYFAATSIVVENLIDKASRKKKQSKSNNVKEEA